jgi:hypothetical protein
MVGENDVEVCTGFGSWRGVSVLAELHFQATGAARLHRYPGSVAYVCYPLLPQAEVQVSHTLVPNQPQPNP